MCLYQRLTMDTEIQEEGGKKMKALDVFCIAIKYLKEQIIRKIQSRVMEAKEDEVLFLLTIPAIWLDQTNAFMRKAAEKVKCGFPLHRFFLFKKWKDSKGEIIVVNRISTVDSTSLFFLLSSISPWSVSP